MSCSRHDYPAGAVTFEHPADQFTKTDCKKYALPFQVDGFVGSYTYTCPKAAR